MLLISTMAGSPLEHDDDNDNDRQHFSDISATPDSRNDESSTSDEHSPVSEYSLQPRPLFPTKDNAAYRSDDGSLSHAEQSEEGQSDEEDDTSEEDFEENDYESWSDEPMVDEQMSDKESNLSFDDEEDSVEVLLPATLKHGEEEEFDDEYDPDESTSDTEDEDFEADDELESPVQNRRSQFGKIRSNANTKEKNYTTTKAIVAETNGKCEPLTKQKRSRNHQSCNEDSVDAVVELLEGTHVDYDDDDSVVIAEVVEDDDYETDCEANAVDLDSVTDDVNEASEASKYLVNNDVEKRVSSKEKEEALISIPRVSESSETIMDSEGCPVTRSTTEEALENESTGVPDSSESNDRELFQVVKPAVESMSIDVNDETVQKENTGTLMAVKTIAVAPAVVADIRTEIELLKSLDHINIVRYLGAETDGTHLHIFQEWVPGGSVTSLLHKFGPFSIHVVRAYLFQILSGLS